MRRNIEVMGAYKLDQERRGLMPSTIERRAYSLRLFGAYLHPRLLAEAIQDDVEVFLDTRKLVPRGRYCWLSNLHSFYVFCIRAGLADADPTADITRPKLRRLLPRPIGVGDLRVALDCAEPRMRVWLLLAALQGLRCKEIAGLDRADVLDQQEPPLLLVSAGKGDRQRVLPLNRRVEHALHLYGMPRSGPVFIRPTGGPFTRAAVSQKINRYLHDLGIKETAHQLRHYFGTVIYRQSKDLRLTQELLGHSSPTTTAVYAAWNPAEAVSIVRDLDVGEAAPRLPFPPTLDLQQKCHTDDVPQSTAKEGPNEPDLSPVRKRGR